MISRQLHNSIRTDAEFPLLPSAQTIHFILTFLKINFYKFANEFIVSNLSINYEDDISRELVTFLQERAKKTNLLFRFEPQKGVDFNISVAPYQLGSLPIFVIEAKRLDINKRDYAYGNTGGIERFKRELSGYGKHLLQSAMIGYIQESTIAYWFKRINSWIDNKINEKSDLVWDNSDKLKQDEKYADFISKHKRITQPPITLYHFWLILYKE